VESSLIDELLQQLRPFCDGRRVQVWQQLAGDYDLLHRGLRAAAHSAHTDSTVPKLDECWQLVSTEAFAERITFYYASRHANASIAMERLYRNSRALVASAQAAVAAQQTGSHPGATERLTQWCGQAALLLGGEAAERTAELEVHWPDVEPTGLVGRAYDALAKRHHRVAAARYWTLCWLSEPPNAPQSLLRVPVAGCDHRGKGFLADLSLQLLAEAPDGELVEHPDMAILPLGSELLDTLQAAWARARQTVCWMLTTRYTAIGPAMPLDGDSLSAATAVAFQLLRDQRPYDATCLILARADAAGETVRKVGSEKAKLEAALHSIRHAAVAQNTDLHNSDVEMFRSRGLEVRRIATVAEAIEFASGLLSDLCRLLEGEVQWVLDDAQRRMGRKLSDWQSFDALFVPVKVARGLRPRLTQHEYEEMERHRQQGDYSSLNKVHKERMDLRAAEIQQMLELPRQTIQWNLFREDLTRAVVLGDPGYGKTMLLWHEVGRRCRMALDHVRTGSMSLEALRPAVFLHALELAEDLAAGPSAEALMDAVVNRVAARHGLGEQARHVLQDKLAGGDCLLALDALDEVPQGLRERLEKALRMFGRHQSQKGRVLGSSRLVGYRQAPFDVAEDDELEVLAFDEPQMEQAITAWFRLAESSPAGEGRGAEANASAAGRQVRQHIQNQSAQVRQMLRCPLLLRLACQTADEARQKGRPLPRWERRGELFDTFLEDGVNRWTERAEHKPTLEQSGLLIELAADLAAELWHRDARRTLWELKEIAPVVNMIRKRYPALSARDGIVDDLCHAGILTLAGSALPRTPLMFTHRSVGEYLTACALARDLDPWRVRPLRLVRRRIPILSWLRERNPRQAPPPRQPVTVSWGKKKSWDPDWESVMLFLAGELKEPQWLLELLCSERRDDVFGHQLALGAQCLAQIDPAKRNTIADLSERITTRSLILWFQHYKQNTLEAVPHLTRALPALAAVNGLVCREKLLSTVSLFADRRHQLATGGSPLLTLLAELLRDEDTRVRKAAVRAVGNLGSKAATPEILAGLAESLRDKAFAPRSLFSPDALNYVPLLLDDDVNIRDAAFDAVLCLDSTAVTPEILAGLREWLRDEVPVNGAFIVADLGRVAPPQTFLPWLLELLRDDDASMRRTAAGAVHWLGRVAATREIVAGLAELVRDDDARNGPQSFALPDSLRERFEGFSCSAFYAFDRLGRVATPELLAWLVELLQDDHVAVRRAAANAVSNMGCISVPAELLASMAELLRDDDAFVRKAATHVVFFLGREAATAETLAGLGDLLSDDDASVRRAAAEAVRDLGRVAATPETLAGLGDLLSDDDASVRCAAAEAVRDLGRVAATRKILAGLARLLSDDDASARLAAVEAVGKLGEAAATPEIRAGLAELLRPDFATVWSAALRGVRCLGSAVATPEFLTWLTKLLPEDDVWSAAAIAAGRVHTVMAMPELLPESLRDGDVLLWSAAAHEAGRPGSAAPTSRFLAWLAELLRDNDARVQNAAIFVVGRLGRVTATPESLAWLAKLLRDDDAFVRKAAVRAVGELSHEAATPETLAGLGDLLSDDDARVRRAVVEALGKLGGAAATSGILAGLARLLCGYDWPELCLDDWSVRCAAAEAVCDLGGTAATPEILAGLTHLLSDAALNRGTSNAVQSSWDRGSVDLFARRVDPYVRSAAVCAAVRYVGRVVFWRTMAFTPEFLGWFLGWLSELLRDDDAEVRKTAVLVVGDLGSVAATPEFLGRLSELMHNDDERIRNAAAEAVAGMGRVAPTPELLVWLAKSLSDHDARVRSAAAHALGHFHHTGLRFFASEAEGVRPWVVKTTQELSQL